MSRPQRAAISGDRIFSDEITIGDLLTWMVLIGSRVTPSGRASCFV